MNLHPQASSAAVKIQETLGEKMAKHHMRGAQEPQRRHTPWTQLWKHMEYTSPDWNDLWVPISNQYKEMINLTGLFGTSTTVFFEAYIAPAAR